MDIAKGSMKEVTTPKGRKVTVWKDITTVWPEPRGPVAKGARPPVQHWTVFRFTYKKREDGVVIHPLLEPVAYEEVLPIIDGRIDEWEKAGTV